MYTVVTARHWARFFFLFSLFPPSIFSVFLSSSSATDAYSEIGGGLGICGNDGWGWHIHLLPRMSKPGIITTQVPR